MSRVAYLDCVGGLAGDMVVGALLDAGASRDALDDAIASLGLGDVKVEVTSAPRHGVVATHVAVVDGSPRTHVASGRLLETVAGAELPPMVRAASVETLRRLIEAEAAVHGVPADEVVLHEVGGVDTLVDVVGSFALLAALDVDRVECSPIPYARGVIRTRHGSIPGPGPAVVSLLRGSVVEGVRADDELVTPTGAAIAAVAATSFGEIPPLRVEAVGYGAGTRDLADRPNLLRVVIGAEADVHVRDVLLLSATVDDVVPELVPDVEAACVAAGALDVWTRSVHMKKGRTGVEITAVARPDSEAAIARALLVHGTTLGVRVSTARRWELEREVRQVTVRGRSIGVKVGILDGRVVNVAPEHDDCAAAAATLGLPVKQVWADALGAASTWVGSDAGDAR